MTQVMTKTRTTQEVFDSHREAIENFDLEKLAADYAEDAILLTLDGAFIGRENIMKGFFQGIATQFPDMKITFEQTAVEDDLLILQWSADSSAASIPAGSAVFLIQDGLIRRQGEWFQLVLKEG